MVVNGSQFHVALFNCSILFYFYLFFSSKFEDEKDYINQDEITSFYCLNYISEYINKFSKLKILEIFIFSKIKWKESKKIIDLVERICSVHRI